MNLDARFSFKAIFVLCFTVLCGATFSPTVNAASVYDTAYQQTSNLEVRGKGYGQDCSTQDVTSSWASKLSSDSTVGNSFNTALSSGSWAVSQAKSDNGYDVYDDYIRVYWTESGSMELNFQNLFSSFYETRLTQPSSLYPIHQALIRSNFAGYVGSQSCNIIVQVAGTSADVTFTDNFSMNQAARELKGYIGVNLSINYPNDNENDPNNYEGDRVADGSSDSDNDLLTDALEYQQASDISKKDTDGDGLSDYVESEWNSNRDATFCKTSVTPHVCSYPSPLSKDLYVEIDWMVDGSTEYKPNSTQLSALENMYATKGIDFHYDLGAYGGGSALPVYASSISFFEHAGILDIHDLKYGGTTGDTGLITSLASQFSVYRQNVWRYMVYGVSLIPDASSSPSTIGGAAEESGDDIIIASENTNAVTGYNYSADRAIAGLLAHELGHVLCLTGERKYMEQNTGCIDSSIDAIGSNNYLSVMNYNYTLPLLANLQTIDYSDGTNGSGDHDDWAAIDEGMGDFIYGGNLTPSYFGNSRKNSKKHVVDSFQKVRGKSEDKRSKAIHDKRLVIPITNPL